MARIVCVAVGLLLLVTTARAEDVNKDKGLGKGLGARPCGEIANEYRRNPLIETLMLQWAYGYWTGANLATFQNDQSYRDLNALNDDAQKQSLFAYCDAHPLAMFVKAAIDVYSQFPLKKY
jgi:hypothetical protein